MNTNESWVLLWQPGTNNLHVEPVEKMLSMNRKHYTDDNTRAAVWLPLIVGTPDDVSSAADAIRPTINARREAFATANDSAEGLRSIA